MEVENNNPRREFFEYSHQVADDIANELGIDALTPCARFSMESHYPGGFYLACSLGEGWLRCWKQSETPARYYRLSYGTLDERRAYWAIAAKAAGDEPCTEWELDQEEKAMLASLLSREALELANAYQDERETEQLVMDGWGLSFYAELADGSPPVIVKNATEWIGRTDSTISKLYFWISVHFGIWGWETERCRNWNKKRAEAVDRALVKEALDGGVDAIESLLFDGKATQIRLIEELDHERPLSYECNYPESFTLRCGRMVSRSCKLAKVPNCTRVFGDSHEFE